MKVRKNTQISRYECPKCGQQITLHGGNTNSTSVVCEKCNTWMHVAVSFKSGFELRLTSVGEPAYYQINNQQQKQEVKA